MYDLPMKPFQTVVYVNIRSMAEFRFDKEL